MTLRTTRTVGNWEKPLSACLFDDREALLPAFLRNPERIALPVLGVVELEAHAPAVVDREQVLQALLERQDPVAGEDPMLIAEFGLGGCRRRIVELEDREELAAQMANAGEARVADVHGRRRE
jgi:hypothetical protein